MEIIRNYFGAIFLGTLMTIVFIWFQFFELPKMEAEKRARLAQEDPTAAPESHSKSSE